MTRAIVAAFILAVFSAGCGEKARQPAVGENAAPTVAELKQKYADIIGKMPAHPQSQEVVDLLCKAASAQTGSIEAAWNAVLKESADDNAGLFMVEQRAQQLGNESQEKLKGFLSGVRKDYAGSAVAVASFDKELTVAAAESPEAFLQKCADALGNGNKGKEASIALLRRGDYHSRNQHFKEAALDRLRFCALFPEKYAQANLSRRFLSDLENAGFLMEMVFLTRGPVSSDFLSVVAADLTGVGARAMANTGLDKFESLTDAYIALTPDLDGLEAANGTSPADPPQWFAEAQLAARRAFLAMHRTNEEHTTKAFAAFIDVAGRPQEVQQVETQQAGVLAEVAILLEDRANEMYGLDGRPSRISEGAHRVAMADLLKKLGVLESTLSDMQLSKVTDAAQAADIVERLAKVQDAHKNRKGVLAAYEDYLARFPDTESTPRIMLALAQYHHKTLRTPAKAVELLAAARQKAPQNKLAGACITEELLCLYDLQQYEKALALWGEIQRDSPDAGSDLSLQLIAALCEEQMGLKDEAERHLSDIVSGHPESPFAEKALFSLATLKLQQQNYASAGELLDDLMQRYPGGSYYSKAYEIRKRLESVGSGR